ncbi:DUF4870 domain-containing protein [Kineococcus gynurae]|uniref:DUF4870 domain-containing protein n=1 Tax=Kineococcus gynurae TaxID=452979 RepID=A0ABV5LQA1_9ACTN
MSESHQPPDFAKHPQGGSHPQDGPRPQGTPGAPGPTPGGYPPYPNSGAAPVGGGYGPRLLSPADQRTWSVLGHLSWIATSWFGLLPLGALIVYLVFKDRGPFVRQQSAEALNFTISVTLYLIGAFMVATLLTVITLGFGVVTFFLPAAVGIAAVVFSIIAAVAAGQGQPYRYPLTIRFVR